MGIGVNRPADRGASAAEYAGLVVLASVVLGALVSAGIPGKVAGGTGQALCTILHTRDCAPGQAGRTGPANPGTTPEALPSARPSASVPPEYRKMRDAVNRALDQTALGREAKAWNERHGIPVDYVRYTGEQPEYSWDRIKIVVHRSSSPQRLAVQYVMKTAQVRAASGLDAGNMPKRAYVDAGVKAVSDRFSAVIERIHVLHNVEQKHALLDEEDDPYARAYGNAVRKAYADADDEDRTLTPEGARLIARQEIAELVRKLLGRGLARMWEREHG